MQTGGKFKYSTVNPDLSHYELKLAFELLEKAGVRGAMQSMHLFLAERQLQRGIRLSHENYSRYGAIETAPLYTAENLANPT